MYCCGYNYFNSLIYFFKSEFHPFLIQNELIEFCRANSIVFQAYSSLGTSDKQLAKPLIENETIKLLAKKYAKTEVQILLKWTIQQGIGVIPKSTSARHLKENIDLFEFELSQSDVSLIRNLNRNEHLCWNPETVL